jgi:surfactin synthase thioesterase subunit
MAGRMAGRRMAARMASRMRRRRRRRRVVLVGGLIAVGVHKMSKKDVERVEEHTGKSAEELSDEELDQAMSDLNIEAEELTDEEFEQAEKAEDDYIAELERLSKLHDEGVITDEEFEAKKKELLNL